MGLRNKNSKFLSDTFHNIYHKENCLLHIQTFLVSHFSFLALFLCPPFVRLSSISVSSNLSSPNKIVNSSLFGPRLFSETRVLYLWKGFLQQKYFLFSNSGLTQLFYMQEFILSSVSLILIPSHHLHRKCKSYPFPTRLCQQTCMVLIWCMCTQRQIMWGFLPWASTVFLNSLN